MVHGLCRRYSNFPPQPLFVFQLNTTEFFRSEPNWIFILAMATFELALAFMLFSFDRTRRDKKNSTKSAVPHNEVVNERRKPSAPTGM